jgi:hypothetical protein
MARRAMDERHVGPLQLARQPWRAAGSRPARDHAREPQQERLCALVLAALADEARHRDQLAAGQRCWSAVEAIGSVGICPRAARQLAGGELA